MTNLKKNYSVPALAILALALCVMLLSQAVIASQKRSVLEEVKFYQGDVPLPAPEAKKPALRQLEDTRQVLTVEGEEPIDRSDRSDVATSVEQGGETIGTATVLAGPYLTPAHVTGTTDGYAHDYDATCGGVNGAPDVVYSFTPAMGGGLALDLCTSSYDTKVWVLTDDGLGGYTEVACDDDGCGASYRSILATFPITSGTTYYIVVGGYSSTDFGAYDMLLTQYGDPGTACANPLNITFLPVEGGDVDEAYPVDLSLSPQGNCSMTASTIGRSYYFNFTSQLSGQYTFTWCDDGTTPLDPQPGYPDGRWTAISYPACGLGAYGWQPDPLVSGALCADNGPYNYPFVVLAGGSQLVEICARSGELLTGTLTITWEKLTAYNDDCANAEDLGIGQVYPGHFVHNIEATMDGPDSNFCDPIFQTCADVWYTWEADETGYVIFDMCDYGSSWDSKLHIYRGSDCLDVSPREADPYGCSDDGCGLFGDGGLVELYATAGERFLIRLAGWYDPTGGDCASQGGMGTGELVIYNQGAISIRPPNDDCDDAVPSTLVSGVTTSETGNMYYSSWDDCPTAYADGSFMIMAWQNYHAFELTSCANVLIDFCGTPDQTLGKVRSQFTNWGTFLGIVVYTGCLCSGDFVATPAASGFWGATLPSGAPQCAAYAPNGDFNRVWQFNSLIPGMYWFEASSWTSGARDAGGYYWTGDYQVNFTATAIPCEYCAATSNTAFCPPTANGSWMSDFSFSNVVKNGDDGPAAGSSTPNDCNGYEDHTDMVAKVYRGFTYPLNVRMRKLTTPRHLLTTDDSCTVYIDWNQNSGFAANQTELGERYTIPGTLSPIYFDRSLNITIPNDAYGPGEGATGETALRVRISVGTPDGTAVACGLMPTGEVEDFTVAVYDLECGDFDVNGLDAGDITFLRAFYFGYGTAPDYWQRGDIDGDGAITIADIIALADALYRSGALNCL